MSVIRPAASCARSSSRKIAVDSLTLTCTSTMSVATGVRLEKRLRSIPITGVMPEPAVTSSSFSGSGWGSTNSPSACSSCSISPARARCTR
jgi:hypothetical protein